MSSGDPFNLPKPTFSAFSAIAVVVGIVVGIGIFRLPSIVASHSTTGFQFMAFWVAGGFISLLGALCYAELAASQPDAGGEYTFLTRAYGQAIGFLFAWGRMTVIQTGSIALVTYILGDYASRILYLGPYSSALYAALAIVGLTGLNLLGTGHSRYVQNILTSLVVLLIILLAVPALFAAPAAPESRVPGGDVNWMRDLFVGGSAGQAMIFVLLTYGGWNEAAYLSAELRGSRSSMARVLVGGIILITALYVLVNLAYLHVLGLDVLQNSQAIGADLAGRIFGPTGAWLVTCIIVIAALSTANATIITGARTNYALGRDFRMLRFIGRWHQKTNTPAHALLLQGGIALLLVGLGLWSQEAVSTIVDYTAPVFWLFILLTTGTLFIFRHRFKPQALPYRVPGYPLTPLLFVAVCGYMLYSSLLFTGLGALVGAAILGAGAPVYWLACQRQGPPGNPDGQ